MSANARSIAAYLRNLLAADGQEAVLSRLRPRGGPKVSRLPAVPTIGERTIEHVWTLPGANATPELKGLLCGPDVVAQAQAYANHIENFAGVVRMPLGIAGPIRVNGLFAHGEYVLPMATTEAALVASYHRGALLLTEAGGCTAALLAEGVSRTPGFAFQNLEEAGRFVLWATSELDAFRACAEATTRHGRLDDMKVTVEGNHVYLEFEYTTGDAAGQNMVTIATEAICDHVARNSPVKPRHQFVEANLSGDKKASARSFLSVRGKKVAAEARIPGDLIRKRLHTTAADMEAYWRMSALGGVMSGTLGVQGHYANGLAALYIACGQDAACVAESAVGVTRFETVAAPEGNTQDLYVSVTLPNLIVGTVGGGERGKDMGPRGDRRTPQARREADCGKGEGGHQRNMGSEGKPFPLIGRPTAPSGGIDVSGRRHSGFRAAAPFGPVPIVGARG
ncbi:MAG: 3-hydroxy-3-methylglutaryl-CoA reductase [Armatimonadota bacterium]